MRVDKGQFADIRVRQAFRLLVNRQEMINASVSGFGVPQYDVVGAGCRYFASGLKRDQDVEQAKSLFKAAGVQGHTFTLPIADAFPGMVESATVLAEQAQAAGVHVNVQIGSAATYYTPAGGYTKRPFGYDVFEPNASLATIFRGVFVRGCPFDDTHWGDGPIQRTIAIDDAIADVNPTTANEKWYQLQLTQFNQGGYIFWANVPFIDAAGPNVRGLAASAGFNFNNWRLQDGWLA
jgi:peptide/nickel transport system substrate-binding protein